MNLALGERKKALRRLIRERELQAAGEDLTAVSARLCDQLRPAPVWRASRCLLSFLPTPGEPDVRPLLEEALARGGLVCLPRFNPGRRDYDICLAADLDALAPGHFGIPEPGPESPIFEVRRLDFVLVPGVAYDMMGRRLGRGKGYFDRLLAGVEGQKCGVAFDWQVVPEVPVEPHDVGVDWLLTPSRLVRCAGGRAG